jgi:hypothetical protein
VCIHSRSRFSDSRDSDVMNLTSSAWGDSVRLCVFLSDLDGEAFLSYPLPPSGDLDGDVLGLPPLPPLASLPASGDMDAFLRTPWPPEVLGLCLSKDNSEVGLKGDADRGGSFRGRFGDECGLESEVSCWCSWSSVMVPSSTVTWPPRDLGRDETSAIAASAMPAMRERVGSSCG